ncbi:MAG: DegT/DnrJ/EryC1/StrS family aminotransferase, partial [Actinomycetota bacterium]
MADKLAVDGGTPVRSGRLPMGRGLAYLGSEETAAAIEVLESRSLFRYYGPNLLNKVESFERSLASLVGAKYAVGLSSGTAALRAGLAAIGVGCGDEVIVPSFTFIASVNAIISMGAVPIF